MTDNKTDRYTISNIKKEDFKIQETQKNNNNQYQIYGNKQIISTPIKTELDTHMEINSCTDKLMTNHGGKNKYFFFFNS